MMGPNYKRFTLFVSSLVLLNSGCWPDTSGNSPDVGAFYFYYPIGLGITQPEGRYLLAASSNFDLQFNSGSLVPIELEALDEVIEACREGREGANCSEFVVSRDVDAADSSYQVVDFVLDQHGVLTGSYSSTLAVTDGMALVPVRADASLHFVDVVEVAHDDLDEQRVLRCAYGESADTPSPPQKCGSNRRVTSGRRLRDDGAVGLPSEPFGVVTWWDADSEMEYVVVGHMVGGEVSLFERLESSSSSSSRECGDTVDNDGDGLNDLDDPGCGGSSLSLIDIDDSFNEGTTGLAVDDEGRFLATSRFNDSLTAFRINSGEIAPVKSIPVEAADPGDNQRGIAMSPDRDLAYVISRSPEAILVLDLSKDESGAYNDRFLAVVEIGNGPSVVRVYEDSRFAAGYMVYVMCYSEDRIFVVDPSVNSVVDIITTRRGPHDIVFDPDMRVAYLANFLESTVSVLDVDPESPSFHTILTTLGVPRRPRTND